MRAQPKASHYVDGAWLEDTEGDGIEVIYPGSGEVIARLHAATPAVIEAALASGARAQGAWAAMRPVERGSYFAPRGRDDPGAGRRARAAGNARHRQAVAGNTRRRLAFGCRSRWNISRGLSLP